jgi:uncharacterized protein with HEPN domain
LRDDQARLEDILRATASIARYAERGRLAFDHDELVQSWMIYHLTLIGEAAARISSALRDQHPEVPWPRVIGMRNVLVHGYFAIDLEEVWVTVDRRVPTLRRQIDEILREETSDGPPSVSERRPVYQLAPHQLDAFQKRPPPGGRLPRRPLAVVKRMEAFVFPGSALMTAPRLAREKSMSRYGYRSGFLHSVSCGGRASGLKC